MEHTKSQAAFEEARQYIPGGVNSPVRSFRSVGGVPPFIAGGKGSKIYDIDGNEYIDYVMSYGPLLMGHVPDCVTEAIKAAAEKGTSYGAPTAAETELAKLVCSLVPSMDMVRMVNSGTEATMSSLRLARAYTGRDCIVKFIGCYHGHHDSLLVKAGSGGATFGVPDSPGVPKAVASTTITVPFNDLPALEQVFAERGEEIACVIMEPTPGNMGLVLPHDGFLEAVRALTKKHGALLICDEVMSGALNEHFPLCIELTEDNLKLALTSAQNSESFYSIGLGGMLFMGRRYGKPPEPCFCNAQDFPSKNEPCSREKGNCSFRRRLY